MTAELELAIRRSLYDGSWHDTIDIACRLYADPKYGKSLGQDKVIAACEQLADEKIIERLDPGPGRSYTHYRQALGW